jgi:hypothetical protein
MSARTRQAKRKGLKRSVALVPERRTIKVYTEGESTEPEYIEALKSLPLFTESVGLNITVVEKGGAPSTLVEMARADKSKSNQDFDSFWCVFDVESPRPHDDLQRAVDMAHGNGIRLAISNPCFELWLILHWQEQSGYLTTSEAVHLRSVMDGTKGKHLVPDLYMPRLAIARQRAALLRKKHVGDGTRFPDDNPSTTFDLFVDEILLAVDLAIVEEGESDSEV